MGARADGHRRHRRDDAPVSVTFHFHLDAWAYAGQTGRLTDAAAYFSGLGGMWDAVWIVCRLLQLARSHE